jgi:hypothetical protein
MKGKRECGFVDTADLKAEIITLPRLRRDGEKAFRAAGSIGNDELLLGEMPLDEFERKDWRW